jgi:hypothetical protein
VRRHWRVRGERYNRKSPRAQQSGDLFQARLDQIINLTHKPTQLVGPAQIQRWPCRSLFWLKRPSNGLATYVTPGDAVSGLPIRSRRDADASSARHPDADGARKKRLISLAKSWLGREDSNLRMVESKSANPLNDFNGHSEKSVENSLKGINRLANDSE